MRISTWLALMIACGTAGVTNTAMAQPALCGGDTPQRPVAPSTPSPQTMAGTYSCTEEGITITLRLDGDGRFVQRFDADPAAFAPAERDDFAEAGLVGRWRVAGESIYLFEKPERAPTLELAQSARDESVRMRIEVRTPDGGAARGLFVGEGPDANPQSELDGGVLTVPLSDSFTPGIHQIVRRGDDLALASFEVTPGGPNIFRFVYLPSEVEPFETRASIMDAGGGAIAVPFGIGAAILRRVSPGK
jgi:hypothetical protein